jgi:hypothetical protein
VALIVMGGGTAAEADAPATIAPVAPALAKTANATAPRRSNFILFPFLVLTHLSKILVIYQQHMQRLIDLPHRHSLQ